MTSTNSTTNRVRPRRIALGLTQADVASRAGISRTAVTAIEGDRMVPSVAAALSLAEALGTSVEELFGRATTSPELETWAWKPLVPSAQPPCWRAEVGGRMVIYPSGSAPMLSLLPDAGSREKNSGGTAAANETLVMACCDPAAGILASQFAVSTGLRLIVLHRSSRQSIAMLKEGLVHIAGLHLSSSDDPDRNVKTVRETLGSGYQMARMARWQEGIVLAPATKLRSVRAAVKAKMSWVGREPGSGARQCLDRLLANRPSPKRLASNHLGVVEAVRSGWADAGVCVQLVSAEAGLGFLPVQEESFDVCFPAASADDRRIKAFLSVARSMAYRKLMSDLPGYNMSETGSLWSVEE